MTIQTMIKLWNEIIIQKILLKCYFLVLLTQLDKFFLFINVSLKYTPKKFLKNRKLFIIFFS